MHFHGLVMTAIVAELSAVKRNRADAPGGAASALSYIYIYQIERTFFSHSVV